MSIRSGRAKAWAILRAMRCRSVSCSEGGMRMRSVRVTTPVIFPRSWTGIWPQPVWIISVRTRSAESSGVTVTSPSCMMRLTGCLVPAMLERAVDGVARDQAEHLLLAARDHGEALVAGAEHLLGDIGDVIVGVGDADAV